MAFGWIPRQVSRLLKQPVLGDAISPEQTDNFGILGILEGLGLAMIKTGAATNHVEETLREVAKVYYLEDLQAVVPPTCVMLQSTTAGGGGADRICAPGWRSA